MFICGAPTQTVQRFFFSFFFFLLFPHPLCHSLFPSLCLCLSLHMTAIICVGLSVAFMLPVLNKAAFSLSCPTPDSLKLLRTAEHEVVSLYMISALGHLRPLNQSGPSQLIWHVVCGQSLLLKGHYLLKALKNVK